MGVLPLIVEGEVTGDRLDKRARRVELRNTMVDVGAHDAGPGDEAAARAEIFADSSEQITRPELLAVAREDRPPQWRAQVYAGSSVEASSALQAQTVDVTKHQSTVDVGNSIVVVADHAIRVGEADARPPTQIALRAHDGVGTSIAASQPTAAIA